MGGHRPGPEDSLTRQSPRLDLLDAPVLLAACGGDPAMLRKMCRTLQSRVPEHLATVREACTIRTPCACEAAHKFYGMLSAFSTAAGDQAADLEDLAAGSHLDEAARIVERLEAMAPELVHQLDGTRSRPLSVAGAHPAVVQLVTCCHFVSGSILPVFLLAMGPLILSASLSVSDEQPGIPQHATRTEAARTVAGSKERIDCLLEKILSYRECGTPATA